jgi:hypothetical protein
LILAVLNLNFFKYSFFGYIYIYNQPKKTGVIKMHIHGGQESCVSFCHRDTIGSKIQRRPKKMHERTF